MSVGKRLGVKYRLSTPVSSVALSPDGRTATGVQLASGEQLNADVVVVNADLVYAYSNLFPPSKRAKSLSKKAASCSSISFYWSMDRVVPELLTHNIFLADDYRGSFDDIFDRQLMPNEPSFYVNVPSRVDPTAAPRGKDSVVVLVPVGHLLDHGAERGLSPRSDQDWAKMIARARETVFSTIEARTGARGLRQAVVNEYVNTPASWKERFNLDKGAILGISHSFFNVLSFRPSTKHPDIERCYFVGASTHPGTGVPVCLAGSKVTTEQILDASGVARPWPSNDDDPGAAPPGKNRVGIDRVQSMPSTRSSISTAVVFILGTLVLLLSFFPSLAASLQRVVGLAK